MPPAEDTAHPILSRAVNLFPCAVEKIIRRVDFSETIRERLIVWKASRMISRSSASVDSDITWLVDELFLSRQAAHMF